MSGYGPPRPPHHAHVIGPRLDLPFPLTPSHTLYPTANLAIYVPFRVFARVVVLRLALLNGSAVSGNFDIGIYDAVGTRLVSTGSTAQSGTLTEQVVDVADTTLGPGLYYAACTLDNTTGRIAYASTIAAPLSASFGVLTEQLGAGGTLPATATWTVNQTLSFYALGVVALLEPTVA